MARIINERTRRHTLSMRLKVSELETIRHALVALACTEAARPKHANGAPSARWRAAIALSEEINDYFKEPGDDRSVDR